MRGLQIEVVSSVVGRQGKSSPATTPQVRWQAASMGTTALEFSMPERLWTEVLPQSRRAVLQEVLQEEQILGELQAEQRRRPGPERREQVLVLRGNGPEELGPRSRGLTFALLVLPPLVSPVD